MKKCDVFKLYLLTGNEEIISLDDAINELSIIYEEYIIKNMLLNKESVPCINYLYTGYKSNLEDTQ